MLEKYYGYKSNYKNAIILIKVGSFYECLDNDALIINKLFHYKIKRLKNNLKVGFPVNNINMILSKLKLCNINYIVVENEITDIYKSDDNQYEIYQCDKEKVLFRFVQLERIIDTLESCIISDSIDEKLEKMNQVIGF